MLEWSQVQAIADKVARVETLGVVRPGDLAEPWRTIFERVAPVEDLALAERVLWHATEGLQNRNTLVEAVLAQLAEARPRRRSLQDLGEDLCPIEWLWPDWIPRGMLSLLGAAPGAGKSLVALDLARRIIHGLDSPCGRARFERGRVIYVDAEAVPQIQNERAMGWDMDRSRLYPMLAREAYSMIDFGLDAHQDELVAMCYDLQPELVVVDSLSSVSMVGENNVEDVRALLTFLSSVAQEFGTSLLLIHHLRKRGSEASLGPPPLVSPDDFRGSGHIITMARSVLGLSVVQDGPELDRNGPRRLEVVKTNLCRYPRPLGLRFEPSSPAPLPGGEGGREGNGEIPRLVYGDAPRPYREPSQQELCQEWLIALMQETGEPMRSSEVYAAGEEAGFSQGVVYRARKALAGRIVDTEPWRSPKNRWRLEGEGVGT
jgi:hypothetical protein